MIRRNSIKLICSIMLLSVIIIYSTPLYESSGWIMIGSMITAITFSNIRISHREIAFLLAFFLAFVVWFVSTDAVFSSLGRFNTLIVSIVMVCCFTVFFHSNKNSENEIDYIYLHQSKVEMIDALCLALFAICFYNIIRYIIKYMPAWTTRVNAKADFISSYNHVDMAVVVMITFFLGLKRNYFVLSGSLLLMSLIVLPARTLKAFALCYFICYIFRAYILKVYKKCILFNRIYKWMIAMTALIIAVCYCWVTILPNYFEIISGHMGLYDTSNYVRSQTILYAVEVILKKHLFISGMYASRLDYSLLISNSRYSTVLGPHNSYLMILLNYSLFLGGMYLIWVANKIDKVLDEYNISFIVSYLVCGLVLHDMLTGVRMLYFLTTLLVPCKYVRGRNIHVRPKAIKPSCECQTYGK